MKRIKVLFFSVLLIVVLSIPANAAKVTLKLGKNKTTASKIITVNDTLTIKIEGVKSKLKWKSSNKKVATITKSGKIKAKSPGKVKLTTKVRKKKYKITVKVYDAAVNYIISDFIRIKNQYSSATARTSFGIKYINLDGEECVITYIFYSIINKYSQCFYHNLSKNIFTSNMDKYFIDKESRAYGTTLYHTYNLHSEALEYAIKALRKEGSFLSGNDLNNLIK